jgi:hypothetical protein
LRRGAASDFGDKTIPLKSGGRLEVPAESICPKEYLAMEPRAQNLHSVLLFSITVITASTALLVGAELYLMLH